jgi:general secretion pathway protein A
MYNEFFGLSKDPFRLTPDPEFLYFTDQHREALAGLTYAILGKKGFVVLTGEAGTGKTTMLTHVLGHLPTARVQSSVIVNPTLSPSEFLEAAMLDFGFKEIPASKAQRILAFQNFLWQGERAGRVSALIVDEAHKLSPEVLEEVRLLGNFESANEKLLQVILLGQTELDELLDREHLRQFKQRIALRLTVECLEAGDVERYIAHRWATAGGTGHPFTPDALVHIWQASRGIPRVINVICDNALMQAFGEGSREVGAAQALTAARELRLLAAAPKTETAPPPPVAAPLAASEPAPPAASEPAVPIDYFGDSGFRTLARYNVARPRASLTARILAKLKLTPKVEPA